jgi:flagellar motility protein MotE (MotC chaperone)
MSRDPWVRGRVLAPLLLLTLTGTALAQAPSEGPLPGGSVSVESASQETPLTCPTSDDLFLAISRERDLIADQRATLDRERAELELLREAVRAETGRLSGLRDEIGGVLNGITRSEEAEVRRLVTVYETMKPDEAARLLDGLDMSVTMTIISNMSEKRAAPVLARMSPLRAQAISRILVEMTRLPEDRNLEGIRIR